MRDKDGWPVRALAEMCRAVGEEMVDVASDAVADHEARMHRNPYGEPNLPSRRTAPITAIPFADWILPDDQTRRGDRDDL